MSDWVVPARDDGGSTEPVALDGRVPSIAEGEYDWPVTTTTGGYDLLSESSGGLVTVSAAACRITHSCPGRVS